MKDALRRWLLVGPVLLYSVILHEIMHGYMALVYGDPTALDAGRLTLNPFPHIDLWGSVLIPTFLILIRSPFFIAWAKPVEVSPALTPFVMMVVAIAGPLTNLALAVACAGLMRVVSPVLGLGRWARRARFMLAYGVLVNSMLMVFNFLPLPALDGSKVLAFLAPPLRDALLHENIYIQFGVLALIMAVPQVRTWLIAFPTRVLGGSLLRWADPSGNWRLS
ncbi:MAG: site-2 protease family protein [Candidatus Eisenbacteria bacterium]|nr:site-2 protease family protein [Candidatus Eisenbacteria bacterium]